jgi:Cys-rich repeat protein
VDSRVSARVIKQVLFTDPGLYPVELVYFQNGSLAYLEWSRSDTAVPECANDVCTTPLTDPMMYPGQFELLAQESLYSSIVGTQPACQECGAPAMPDCAAGNYCGDGLCQACVTAEHCGAACVKCPENRYLCSAGSCVMCVSDDQCPNGEICDPVLGNCIPPAPCAYQSDCPIAMECDACAPNVCSGLPVPCTADSQCPSGQVCGARRYCAAPPVPCSSDATCPPRQLCDTAAGFCTCSLAKPLYVGGCAAGKTWAAGRETGVLLGLGLLFSVVALTQALRRRRVCVRASPLGTRRTPYRSEPAPLVRQAHEPR